MTRRIPFLAALAAALVAAALPGTARAGGDPPPAGDGAAPRGAPAAGRARLVVVLKGFHNDVGQARVNVFDHADGFPSRHQAALRSASSDIRDGVAGVVFEGLAPGTYAVSALHDENSDAIAQVNWLGIPTEGVGTSNDAQGLLGPPKWDDAKFDLPAAGMTVTCKMRY